MMNAKNLFLFVLQLDMMDIHLRKSTESTMFLVKAASELFMPEPAFVMAFP